MSRANYAARCSFSEYLEKKTSQSVGQIRSSRCTGEFGTFISVGMLCRERMMKFFEVGALMGRSIIFGSVSSAVLLVAGGLWAQAGQTQAGQAGPEIAQQCLQDVQRLNQELINAGYGAPIGAPNAPAGAGYGAGTVGNVPPTAPGGYGAMTPRGEMRILMQAAYVLAINGDEEACQSVLANMAGTAEAAVQNQAGVATTWREQAVSAAVPVTELRDTIQMDRVLGADVLGMAGDDLGDIDDVILGPEGRPNYVLVSRGGFLGIGEDLIPVRWEDLRVTVSPYQDVFVLGATEDALESAPTVGDSPQSAQADWPQVDRFWDETLER